MPGACGAGGEGYTQLLGSKGKKTQTAYFKARPSWRVQAGVMQGCSAGHREARWASEVGSDDAGFTVASRLAGVEGSKDEMITQHRVGRMRWAG